MNYKTINTGTSQRLAPVGATLNLSFGSKTLLGGSTGTTLTTKPIKF